MNCNKKIKIKHLLTKSKKYEDIKDSMIRISNILENHFEFNKTTLIHKMRNIPKGDVIINHVDYSKKLLDMVYSIADENRIWIE